MNLVQLNAILDAETMLKEAISSCLVTLEFYDTVTLYIAMSDQDELQCYLDSQCKRNIYDSDFVLVVDTAMTKLMLNQKPFLYDPSIEMYGDDANIKQVLSMVVGAAIECAIPHTRSGMLTTSNFHNGQELILKRQSRSQIEITMGGVVRVINK